MRTILGGALIVGLTLPAAGRAAPERVDYLREVKPVLATRCWACHGALQQKADLRLDTAAFLKQGGESGPAIVAGKSGESLLVQHITAANGANRMPPASEGEGLTEAQIAHIRTWIDQGAAAPPDEKPDPDPREHWAFRPPQRPPLPAVKNAAWVRNPVDAFIVAEYEKRGLVPQKQADKGLLLRRVYLDLIGLPPTRAEMTAFLADPSSDGYDKVVDRLLASPQYGERWGRHWMDVWRYSDWWGLGVEVRNSQKHMWHWRDWIIESLNHDKGYDQMVREMLAADELYPNDLDRLRATGFLARNYFRFNRTTWMDEVIEHTSKAFLGLTVNCAKCHDHKYDPIAQTDYYRLRAFFEPYQVRLDQLPGEVDLEKDGLPRVFDCHLEAPTYLHIRGDEKRPKQGQPLTPGVPSLLALGELAIRPVTLPAEAHAPGLRPFVLENHLRNAERQITAARQAVDQARQALAAVAKGDAAALAAAQASVTLGEKTLTAAEAQPRALQARAAADRARIEKPAAAAELARQAARVEKEAVALKADEDVARAEQELAKAADAKKAEAEKKATAARTALATARKALETPGDTYTPLRGGLKTAESPTETEAQRLQPFPPTSTGRRSALAGWLTDPRNPLPARVAVNHIWARHFGKPLAPSVFDFGRRAAEPSHRALLDYLAVELQDNRWSMKHIHRLLVTSNTYRLTSSAAGAAPPNRTADPENRLYWRMNPARMESELVRDSLLHLAGELDPKLGGASIPTADAPSRRRSLYFVHSHNDHQKFLSMFDDASVLECYRRAESVVPQQALALANSALALAAAEKIAGRLEQELGAIADEEFIRAAFALVLGSPPTAAEQNEAKKALLELTELLRQNKQTNPNGRARADLVHALLNHNDFVTVR